MQVAANAGVALEQAFSQLQHDPQVANDYAMARLLEGRPREAIGLLEYSLELDPELPDTYGMLGQAYAADGRIEEAMEVLERALSMGVGGAQALATLGDLARQSGDLSQAFNYYGQAVAEDPENWILHYNLGLMYGEIGDSNEAINSLMTALSVAPPAEQQRVQDAIDSVMGTGEAAPLP
jgi:tetratricopeptide (TPR) repeat protein